MVRYKTSVVAAVLMTFCITGCASPSGTFCSIAKPHRFSDTTVNAMTDAEVAQELTHNKQGAALCGWKP